MRTQVLGGILELVVCFVHHCGAVAPRYFLKDVIHDTHIAASEFCYMCVFMPQF